MPRMVHSVMACLPHGASLPYKAARALRRSHRDTGATCVRISTYWVSLHSLFHPIFPSLSDSLYDQAPTYGHRSCLPPRAYLILKIMNFSPPTLFMTMYYNSSTPAADFSESQISRRCFALSVYFSYLLWNTFLAKKLSFFEPDRLTILASDLFELSPSAARDFTDIDETSSDLNGIIAKFAKSTYL